MEDFPKKLMSLLEKYANTMDADLRKHIVQALILLRNRNLITPITLLPLFFILFRCPDKQLREYLKNHIISDIKKINQKHKNNQLNKLLQNFMFTMLQDNNETAAKKSLEVMVELYRKKIWDDAKTVNVISSACFSSVSKILTTALTFFIGEKDIMQENFDNEKPSSITQQDIIDKYSTHGKKNKKKEKKIRNCFSKS